ncbi:hypothetical protein [Gorillibacterium timonense]|uniref:hypothetical protein n=1 Tax=Gorillibacterium timonense TaxID=1689269 RepID=UPI00071E2708|nr:hypothetical protein [Gorillibacterium timonense]
MLHLNEKGQDQLILELHRLACTIEQQRKRKLGGVHHMIEELRLSFQNEQADEQSTERREVRERSAF